MRALLFAVSVVFGAALVVLSSGCASQPVEQWQPTRPASLRPERCDMGLLRMTKGMACVDELHRAPLWGRS